MMVRNNDREQAPIRILLADDHAIVRKGLRALLVTEPGLEVVAEAENGEQAIAEARRLRPDVVLMDLVMPGTDGLEATRRIVAEQPGGPGTPRVLVLTSFATDDKVFPALRAGALGYLLKDAGPEELVQAIHRVYRGESSLHPSIARRLLQELAVPGQEAVSGLLSPRELDVLRLVAQGWHNRDIAAHLGIGEATVRTHVSSILSKLHLGSRTQAALYAIREGLAPLADQAGARTKPSGG